MMKAVKHPETERLCLLVMKALKYHEREKLCLCLLGMKALKYHEMEKLCLLMMKALMHHETETPWPMLLETCWKKLKIEGSLSMQMEAW